MMTDKDQEISDLKASLRRARYQHKQRLEKQIVGKIKEAVKRRIEGTGGAIYTDDILDAIDEACEE